jgi:hypothetical protein
VGQVRIFKNKAFIRFATKEDIVDAQVQRGARAFSSTALQRTKRTTYGMTSWPPVRKLATELLAYEDKVIARVVVSGALLEVMCGEKAVP